MNTPTPPPINRTRVLCVDDNRDVAAAIRLLVDSEASMECAGCLGTADGLVEEVCGRHPRPDVVILDATMPGPDPLGATRQLAAECPSTRTIIYSGYDGHAVIERARSAGAWGFVSKHDEPQALVRAVRNVAAGRHDWPGRSSGDMSD